MQVLYVAILSCIQSVAQFVWHKPLSPGLRCDHRQLDECEQAPVYLSGDAGEGAGRLGVPLEVQEVEGHQQYIHHIALCIKMYCTGMYLLAP